MADASDSKSDVGDHVRVQVPPPAFKPSDMLGFFVVFKSELISKSLKLNDIWCILELGLVCPLVRRK